MAHDKCAYCETKLGQKDSYMEVEHYRCKSLHPKLVVEWSNLLPSCKRCNTNKGTHDVDHEAIINPAEINPKEHLKFYNNRYYAKDDSKLGKSTISVLALNHYERLSIILFETGVKICESLSSCRMQMESPRTDETNRELPRQLTALLREAQPDKEFSAFTATIILGCPDYEVIKGLFVDANMWTTEMNNLERVAIGIALL